MKSFDATHTERTEGIRTLAAEETAKVAGAAAFLQGDLVASQPAQVSLAQFQRPNAGLGFAAESVPIIHCWDPRCSIRVSGC